MTNNTEGEAPRIQVDSDWKAEAQAEKERLASAAQDQAAEEAADPAAGGQLPPADFRGLMGILASQAMYGLGGMGDPDSGKMMVDLVGSKYAIDLLGVLEEKTAGNLSEEEAKEIGQLLGELRSRFVQIADAIAQQQMQNATDPTNPGGANPGGVIETP